MVNLIVKPKKIQHKKICSACRHATEGKGFLLNGSSGAAGTMTSDAPTMGINNVSGLGLGRSVLSKLQKLRYEPKRKPENIKFSI